MSVSVEWWGEIPARWARRRFKQTFKEREERSIAGEETLLSVSAYTGVTPRSEIIDDGDHLTRASTLEGYKVCYPNDLVMNIMLAWNRGLGFSKQKGIVSPSYAVFEVIDDGDARFLDYLLRSNEAIAYFEAFSSGVIQSRLRLYPETFGQLHYPRPQLSEQIAVATFLDCETAKIDALVEEQRRLIEVLKEKRQAVISHAVTKGLNPDVPMSDTGIEWLGEVPTHWEVAPLKRYWSVTDCKHVTAEFVDEGYPLASIRECQRRFVDLSAAKQTTDEFYQALIEGGRTPQPGDLIFTRNATVGRVSQVADWHPPFAMGQDVCLLRRNDDLQSADYLQSALEASSTVQQLEVLMIGSTFKRVNVEEIRNLLIAFAPAAEQGEIASYLEHQTTKFDELISTAESTVLLLQERRAALISAAVTGKIDVRGQSTSTVVTPDFRHSRKLVAAKIVEDLAAQKTFGRVKLQKLLYLAEAHSGIHELSGHYTREAAGPLDRDMVREVEMALEASGHVFIEQPEGRGTAVNYQLRGTRGAFETQLQTLLGDRISALSELIDTVGALDTRGAEAVATLYAAWNDALASGTVPSDDEVIREVLNEWHPKKAETFTAADLKNWLAWMRRNGLNPKGNAPVTSTGRLFT